MVPGSYDISLTVQSLTGCVITLSITEEDAVTVYEDPVAGFEVNPTTVSIFEPTVFITDNSEGSVDCEYEMGDGGFVQDCSFDYTYTQAGYFEIIQTVVNETGCVAQTSEWVLVEGYAFYAPNVFSPNGDGINEVFLPSILGASEYRLEIYDRWGERIFKTTDQKEAWIGNVKGGEHYAQDGVYVYKVFFKDMLNFPYEFTGHVTLIR